MTNQQLVGLPGDEEGDKLSRLGCISVVDNGELVGQISNKQLTCINY